MDRTAGCVTGGEEVYLLCDKVQKGELSEQSFSCFLFDTYKVRVRDAHIKRGRNLK